MFFLLTIYPENKTTVNMRIIVIWEEKYNDSKKKTVYN